MTLAASCKVKLELVDTRTSEIQATGYLILREKSHQARVEHVSKKTAQFFGCKTVEDHNFLFALYSQVGPNFKIRTLSKESDPFTSYCITIVTRPRSLQIKERTASHISVTHSNRLEQIVVDPRKGTSARTGTFTELSSIPAVSAFNSSSFSEFTLSEQASSSSPLTRACRFRKL